jgi:hypothetical protein
MSLTSFIRQLVRGRAPGRPAPRKGFVPQVTELEGRTVPSGVQQVPFQETLTLVGEEDGVLSYVGRATHFGKVTATLDTETNVFTKTAANGDTAVGFVTHASETTGSITLTGGTGRFDGVTGDSTYVISVDDSGTVTVDVIGTISNGYSGKPQGPKGGAEAKVAAKSANTVTVPFKLTGGGPADEGLPLFKGGKAAHTSTGTATHLGRHTGSGEFTLESPIVVSPTGEASATFSGTYTFEAANGDLLVMTYGAGGTGKVTAQLSPDGLTATSVRFDAIFTVDGDASTGRFAGATGSFRMIATAESISLVGEKPGFSARFDYSWTGEGELTLKKGKK